MFPSHNSANPMSRYLKRLFIFFTFVIFESPHALICYSKKAAPHQCNASLMSAAVLRSPGDMAKRRSLLSSISKSPRCIPAMMSDAAQCGQGSLLNDMPFLPPRYEITSPIVPAAKATYELAAFRFKRTRNPIQSRLSFGPFIHSPILEAFYKSSVRRYRELLRLPSGCRRKAQCIA